MLIDRDKAIEAINKVRDLISVEAYCAITERLKELPSAERKGHWIDGHCSECGCDVPAYVIDWRWQKDMDAKFCPNCGARMVTDA